MQPISIIIVLLCGFTAFNSAPSNVAGAITSYQFRTLFYGDSYYRSSYYTSVIYRKYRSTIMNRLKRYYRAYSYYYNFAEARLYHNAYSYVARLNGYRASTSYFWSRQCGNFETNVYGDFIGFFKCPLFFEPRNFTYCCGAKRSHFCCSLYWKSNPYTTDPKLGYKPTTTATPARTTPKPYRTASISVYFIVGVTFSILLVIGIITGGVVGCICCCRAANRPQPRPLVATASSTTVATNIGPGEGLQQPHPGQPWTATSYLNPTAPAPYPQQSYAMITPPTYDACYPPGAAQPQVGAAEPSALVPPPYPGPATA